MKQEWDEKLKHYSPHGHSEREDFSSLTSTSKGSRRGRSDLCWTLVLAYSHTGYVCHLLMIYLNINIPSKIYCLERSEWMCVIPGRIIALFLLGKTGMHIALSRTKAGKSFWMEALSLYMQRVYHSLEDMNVYINDIFDSCLPCLQFV